MTWLVGFVEVTVYWPHAHLGATSDVRFQVVADERGAFSVVTSPDQLPTHRRKAVAQTTLHATPAGDGAYEVVLEVEVRQRTRPTLFLHDDLQVGNGEPVFAREGDLSVKLTLEQCNDAADCRTRVHYLYL